ncbi:MAG: class I SAM-dependent methyltransferase [Spirochaetota bacterium]
MADRETPPGRRAAELPEHVRENRSYWDGMAHEWVEAGERHWAQDEPTWGIWGLPESELRLLPPGMAGMTTIELGCGTGYVSAWMTRLGATAVGIDNSEEQLRTGRRLAREHGLGITFVHGNAEDVAYANESFDFAISEYGAAIWCDPYRWIAEAHRLLKPGCELVFLGTHPLAIVCAPYSGKPTGTTLQRSWFDLHVQDWRNVEFDPGGVEFNLSPSRWFRLFRETGFEVVDFQELRAPAHLCEDRFSIPVEWAKRWPSEQVWKLRKRA